MLQKFIKKLYKVKQKVLSLPLLHTEISIITNPTLGSLNVLFPLSTHSCPPYSPNHPEVQLIDFHLCLKCAQMLMLKSGIV
jgi:hypothetical protein